MKISLNVQSVFSKALFATILAGAATVVGCKSGDAADGAVGNSTQAMVGSAPSKGAVDMARQAAASPAARLSAVTCTGDQNNGGRICCDETHCCINIGGTINCELPPRSPKTAISQTQVLATQ
jgi:hypothetical protein